MNIQQGIEILEERLEIELQFLIPHSSEDYEKDLEFVQSLNLAIKIMKDSIKNEKNDRI